MCCAYYLAIKLVCMEQEQHFEMLVCKSVSVWCHDLSTKHNSTGALDRRAVFGLMQIMERERTAYEYQEGSV